MLYLCKRNPKNAKDVIYQKKTVVLEYVFMKGNVFKLLLTRFIHIQSSIDSNHWDHCIIEGGAVHSTCKLKLKVSNEIPVVFHNV